MSIEDRKRQGKTVLRWLWTGLTGSADELRELATDAIDDVRDQVEERRGKRVLNEGTAERPELPPGERRQP